MRILDSGQKKHQFWSIAFDPTGQLLAAGGAYGPVVLWDVTTGERHARFSDLPYAAPALVFHPTNGRLLLPTDRGLQACDVKTGVLTAVGSGIRSTVLPTFAPDKDRAVYCDRLAGRSVLSAAIRLGESAQATVWDTRISDSADVIGVAVDLTDLGDGKHFASAEYTVGQSSQRNYRVAVRSWADGSVVRSASNIFGSDARLFSSRVSGAIIIQNGMGLRVYRADELAAVPHVIRNDNRKHFTGIAFHPSGRFLAATSNDATVKLYDTATWEVSRTFIWDIGRMRSIAFSPDGTLAAAGSDTGKVVVWDVDV